MCSPVSICDDGATYKRQAPTISSDRVCADCSACDTMDHIVATCTIIANTVCSECLVCEAGVAYAKISCATGQPTVCATCTACSHLEYETGPCRPDADRVCAKLTTCHPDEMELDAPTLTSDRTCSALAACSDGEYEVTAPVYLDGGRGSTPRVCKTITTCQLPAQYVAVEATRTTDAVQAGRVSAAGTGCQHGSPLPARQRMRDV